MGDTSAQSHDRARPQPSTKPVVSGDDSQVPSHVRNSSAGGVTGGAPQQSKASGSSDGQPTARQADQPSQPSQADHAPKGSSSAANLARGGATAAVAATTGPAGVAAMNAALAAKKSRDESPDGSIDAKQVAQDTALATAGAVAGGGAASSSAGASAGGAASKGAAKGAGEKASEKAGEKAAASAENLGQGGTSTVGTSVKSSQKASAASKTVASATEDDSLVGDVVKAGAATGGVVGAQQALTMMMFLNWLKSLIASVIAAAQNFLQVAIAFVLHAVAGVAGAFGAAGVAIAGMLGMTVVGGTVMAGVAAVLVASLVGSLIAGAVASPVDDTLVAETNCVSNTQLIDGVDNSNPSAVSATQTANAKTVYSVLGAWGMSDANIAGILGNWQAESGIDPTSVQGIYSPKYTMNAEKSSRATETHNGIGLGQWTGGRNTKLRAYAQKNNSDWWALSTQLGFMVSKDEGSDAQIVRGMIKTDQGDPATAAFYFHDKWERSADTPAMAERRARFAREWFANMDGWTTDQTLADSILEQSDTVLDNADDTQLVNASLECEDFDAADVTLADGGMTKEQAQKLIDLYNEEGDAFLDKRYGPNGGPGSCGTNHAMNCVSFTTYFLNKYTSFQQYPRGNGIQTARTLSLMTGKGLQTTPTAYSVGSGPGTGPAGHTLVVLGVEGDQVIVGEAGYCSMMGTVTVYSAAKMKAKGWVFVDVSDLMLDESEVKTA